MADAEKFLDNLEFSVDAEGTVRVQDGTICGNRTGTRTGERMYRQMQEQANAPTEADVEGYEKRIKHPDAEQLLEDMNAMVNKALEEGRISEDEAKRIQENHRVCNEEMDAIYPAWLEAQADAPRLERLAALREQLAAEDEQTGGRNTTRRWELLREIVATQAAR